MEWPLMIFTVLGQCVVGGFAVMALALLSGRLDEEVTRKVHRSMIVLWVLMGIAFIASITHLGSPLRAFNSLNRLGSSSLSNEIAMGALFFVVGGVYWLLAVQNKLPAGSAKPWLIATIVIGFGFVLAMCRVYDISTVPTWSNAYTPLGFFVTVFIGGPILGYLLLRVAGVPVCDKMQLLPVISVCALLISAIAYYAQAAGLSTIHSSVQTASALIPNLGSLLGWRLLLLVVGLGCWICPVVSRKTPSVAALSAGFVLVFIGELIGRGVFYGLHMTVGMTVGG